MARNPKRFYVESRPHQCVDGERAWVFVVRDPQYDATFARGEALAQFIEKVMNASHTAFTIASWKN